MQAFRRLVKPFEYVVFLSFRGPDTRYTFTGNLYKALKPLFRTFMDDREVKIGYNIPDELSEGIEKSRIFIIVLSENFASSKPCLKEVVKILDEYKKGKGRWVLPVFYDVDPSDLAGTYEKALTDWKGKSSEEKIKEWSDALMKLPEFHHIHFDRNENIPEYKHIENILKEVSRHVTLPIGISKRVRCVNSHLSSGSDKVCVIGICGKAGIGKTTLAREVYNVNANRGFVHFCLLYEGEEISSDVLSILKGKKVFIIFEDIKNSKQLENIKKLIEQLGPGSKVIITSEDEDLLKSSEIGSIYYLQSFSQPEANKFLAFKVFNSKEVDIEYVDIVNRIQIYTGGHPETLELIGSNLSGKSVEKCKSALKKYESILDRDIQKILETSFNDLNEGQQDMLIDIASGCEEEELELVRVEAKLRNKYQVCPRIDIRVLLDNSLIKINQHGQLTLRTTTREMINRVKAMKHGHGQRE